MRLIYIFKGNLYPCSLGIQDCVQQRPAKNIEMSGHIIILHYVYMYVVFLHAEEEISRINLPDAVPLASVSDTSLEASSSSSWQQNNAHM